MRDHQNMVQIQYAIHVEEEEEDNADSEFSDNSFCSADLCESHCQDL